MCAPKSNPVLRDKLPPIKIVENLETEKISTSNTQHLPCWFVEYYQTCNDKKSPDNSTITGIRIKTDNIDRIISSPSEEAYKFAKELVDGEPYIEFFESNRVMIDYGIFARLTMDGNCFIIISGIHQYGTWIVSDFLDRLFQREYKKYTDIFFSDIDFISIIGGEFDSKKLSVCRADIYEQYLWCKQGDRWERATRV